VIEKKAPWLYNVFEIHESMVWAGQKELKNLLANYAMCKANYEWPGYRTENQVTMLTATERFIRRTAESLEEGS
jgi:hypothetical protein